MSFIPYIYIRTRAREACGPSSRRNTLQMSRLAIIFFFFSFSIFSSARRGVGSAHPSPYPVLPSRRCPARPASMPRAPCVDALTHGPTGQASHASRAVGPMRQASHASRAVGPSSLCAECRAFGRASCDARNVDAGRVPRSPERRPSLETALHNRRNGLTLNKLRTQPPKLHKSCINTHKRPAYMQLLCNKTEYPATA